MSPADTLRDVDTISQYLGLTFDTPHPEDRQRAREALTRLSAEAARVGELEAALQRIARQAHISGGQWAMEMARAALAKDHSR